jgi:hypothetical protein
MPPGMMPGMMGGAPGMMGGGGAGGPLTWSETPPDPHFQMTYPEYLAASGQKAATMPAPLLTDSKGQPVERTQSGWDQLQQLYGQAGVAVVAPTSKRGKYGSQLYNEMQEQLAVIRKENLAVLKAFGAVSGGFTFKVGTPQYDRASVNSSGATLRVGVIMRVKPQLQKNYGALIYKYLKPYDNYGDGRVPFQFVTYQGGYYRPVTLMLHPSSVALWNALWSAPAVALVLQDARGTAITTSNVTAGFSGTEPTLIAYPPEIQRTPAFAYLFPEADRAWNGGRMNLDYAKGWYYEFQFQLTMEDLVRVDKAKAGLIVPSAKLLLSWVAGATTPEQVLPMLQPQLQKWMSEQVTGFGFPPAPAPPASGAGSPGAFTPQSSGTSGVKSLVPGGVGAGYALPPPVTGGLPL